MRPSLRTPGSYRGGSGNSGNSGNSGSSSNLLQNNSNNSNSSNSSNTSTNSPTQNISNSPNKRNSVTMTGSPQLLNEAVRAFEDFKKLFGQTNPVLDKCEESMEVLKLHLTKLTMEPFQSQEEEKRRLIFAREILEQGALLSIRKGDIPSFARYIAQLKTYYYDYSQKLADFPSQLQWPLLGSNLLRLLASSKLEEFHTELELVPFEQFTNIYIKHAIQLEQFMMEGAYNKVIKSKLNIPDPIFAFFIDMLMKTVREQIAVCAEEAYEPMSVSEAMKLFNFVNPEEFKAFAKTRHWQIIDHMEKGQVVSFNANDETKNQLEIPSFKIIKQNLHYARELERIV